MGIEQSLEASFSAGAFNLNASLSGLEEVFRLTIPGTDVDLVALADVADELGRLDLGELSAACARLTDAVHALAPALPSPVEDVARLGALVADFTGLAFGLRDAGGRLRSIFASPPAAETPIARIALAATAVRNIDVGAPAALTESPQLGATLELGRVVLGHAIGLTNVTGTFGRLMASYGTALHVRTCARVARELWASGAVRQAEDDLLAIDAPAISALVRSDPSVAVNQVAAAWHALLAYSDAVGSGVIGGATSLQLFAPVETARFFTAAVTGLDSSGADVRALAEDFARFVLVLLPEPSGAAGASAVVAAEIDRVLGELRDAAAGVDVGDVRSAFATAAQAALRPLEAINEALDDIRGALSGAMGSVRDALSGLDLRAVRDAIAEVSAPLEAVLDRVVTVLEEARAALEAAANETEIVLGSARASARGAVEDVDAAFRRLADTVSALDLDTAVAGIRQGVAELTAQLESITVEPAVDEVVDLIDAAARVIGAIPFDLLPAAARAEVGSALGPVRAISFEAEVGTPAGDVLSVAFAPLQNDLLGQLRAAYREIVRFLERIDPRPILATIESEAFGPLVEGLRVTDPTVLFRSVAEGLASLPRVEGLFADADAAFDSIVVRFDEFDPGSLLQPFVEQVSSARETLTAVTQIDRLEEALDLVEQAVDDTLGDLEPAVWARALGGILESVAPEAGSGSEGLFVGRIIQRLLDGRGPSPAESATAVLRWLLGADARAEVDRLLAAAAEDFAAAQASARTFDVAAILARVQPGFADLRASVGALADDDPLSVTLGVSIDLQPGDLLSPVVEARGAYLASLDEALAATRAAARADTSRVTSAVESLRQALEPLQGVGERIRGIGARVGVSGPERPLRSIARETIALVEARLETGPGADLIARLATDLRAIILDGVLQPFREALQSVRAAVDALDLAPTVEELRAVHARIRGEIETLKPSVVLAGPLHVLTSVAGSGAAVDPVAGLSGPIDRMRRAAEEALAELRPSTLLGGTLEAYDGVVAALAVLDVETLVAPAFEALLRLKVVLEEGLADAGAAFARFQAALPTGEGGGGVSVTARGSISPG